MRIAILGATGYVGRSLAVTLARDPRAKLSLFVRDVDQAEKMLRALRIPESVQIHHIGMLLRRGVDVIVNATGIGSPLALQRNPRAIFDVTEAMDALLIAYHQRYPGVRIFNISTGAVFGESCGNPITDAAKAVFNPDAPSPAMYYAIAKLTSELKHRAHGDIPIVDLRLFSFFSAQVDVTDLFLLSQLVQCARQNQVFTTGSDDIVRDYATPEMVSHVLFFLLQRSPENTAYDLRSAKPVTKFDLLTYFKETWGLRIAMTGEVLQSPTGKKHAYYSCRTALADMGCAPKYTSLEAIDRVMREMQRVEA